MHIVDYYCHDCVPYRAAYLHNFQLYSHVGTWFSSSTHYSWASGGGWWSSKGRKTKRACRFFGDDNLPKDHSRSDSARAMAKWDEAVWYSYQSSLGAPSEMCQPEWHCWKVSCVCTAMCTNVQQLFVFVYIGSSITSFKQKDQLKLQSCPRCWYNLIYWRPIFIIIAYY